MREKRFELDKCCSKNLKDYPNHKVLRKRYENDYDPRSNKKYTSTVNEHPTQ